MAHRLDPLLNPRSIAVVGATEREQSVGRRTVHNLLAGGYQGDLYAVNPGRESVLGVPCFPGLDALPATVEHVVFTVSDYRIEAALADAIRHGAKAATIMSQLIIDGDSEPRLQQRIEQLVAESGILVCGANGMGFYNCVAGTWVCGFDTRENHLRGGNVTLISHSGSGMSGIFDCEERIDFNLAVSTGQEINVAMHDYMDFAIEEHAPRVIGLFMETIRDPQAMFDVLGKAAQRQIPVVVLKVGRTAMAAKLAESHSGAMAGTDAAYEAIFDRYGVQRVGDMDAFASTLMMFAQPREAGPGGLVTLHDSGGERQLLIDLADELNVPLTALSPDTTRTLAALLDPGLPAVNPLDAWGAGGPENHDIMAQSLSALMLDQQASIGALVHDRAPYSQIYPEYAEYIRPAAHSSGKPVFLVSNRQGSGSTPAAVSWTREGIPVIDGLRSFLEGARCMLAYRDFLARPRYSDPGLRAGFPGFPDFVGTLPESASLRLLADAGLPVVPSREAENETDAVAAARSFGFPVAIKTAAPGISHKSDNAGVFLNVADEEALGEAYRDLARRLGPQVAVSPMAGSGGLEMLIGMTNDEQFGPLVVLGFGGTRAEALKDVAWAMPPFDAATARRRLETLRQRPLLTFHRGEGAPDIDAFCEMAALFSELVAELGHSVTEIDINPVIVSPQGCVAVDALIIGSHTR